MQVCCRPRTWRGRGCGEGHGCSDGLGVDHAEEDVGQELLHRGKLSRPSPAGGSSNLGAVAENLGTLEIEHLVVFVFVVEELEELPRLGLGLVQFVALTPRSLWVWIDVGGREKPGRDATLGGRHELHAPLDGMVVLVAGHASDVEKDATYRIGNAALDLLQARRQLSVAAASVNDTRDRERQIQSAISGSPNTHGDRVK